jgi:hypothetical protein
MEMLDKRSKHMLVYSNINSLNFVDINKSNYAKAWTVLFHFGKLSTDSMIYDEFETIVTRNALGKSKGHELFTKLFLNIIE